MPLAASDALPPDARDYVQRKIPHILWSLSTVALEGDQLAVGGWMNLREGGAVSGADAAPTVTFDAAEGAVSVSPIEGRPFACSFSARSQIESGPRHVAVVPTARGERSDDAMRRRPLFVRADLETATAEIDWPFTEFRRVFAVLLEENRHRIDLKSRSLLSSGPSRVGDFFSDFGPLITQVDAIDEATAGEFHLVVAELPSDLSPDAIPPWLEALAGATAKDGSAIVAYPGDAVSYASAVTREAIDALDRYGVLDRWNGGDEPRDPTPRTLMTDAWAHARFSRDFWVSRIAFAATTRHQNLAVLRPR